LRTLCIKNTKAELVDKFRNEISTHYYRYAEEYPPEWRDAWKVTKALILKLKEKLETDKIGFLVIIVRNEFESRGLPITLK